MATAVAAVAVTELSMEAAAAADAMVMEAAVVAAVAAMEATAAQATAAQLATRTEVLMQGAVRLRHILSSKQAWSQSASPWSEDCVSPSYQSNCVQKSDAQPAFALSPISHDPALILLPHRG